MSVWSSSHRFVGAIALLAMTSVGCAFTDLEVHPPSPVDLTTQSNVGRGRQVIVVIPFDDARPDPTRCGMQKNGMNMDTAKVECKVAPTQWLAHALAQALQASGFDVHTQDAPRGPSSVQIQGVVRQFFVEPKVGFFTFTPEADISVNLVVTSPSGLHAERTFYFKSEEVSMIGTEDNFQAAARTATQDAVRGMVAALVALLDRYPQLGASSAPVAVSAVHREEVTR